MRMAGSQVEEKRTGSPTALGSLDGSSRLLRLEEGESGSGWAPGAWRDDLGAEIEGAASGWQSSSKYKHHRHRAGVAGLLVAACMVESCRGQSLVGWKGEGEWLKP